MERAKPALPLEEEFDNLFLEDLVWAHAVSLHQRLNTPQFHFAAPLVVLFQRGLQDKEQIKRLTPEVEFVVRYTATIGGRRKEPRVGLGLFVQGVPVALRPMNTLADQLLARLGEHVKGYLGVEGRPLKSCFIS